MACRMAEHVSILSAGLPPQARRFTPRALPPPATPRHVTAPFVIAIHPPVIASAAKQSRTACPLAMTPTFANTLDCRGLRPRNDGVVTALAVGVGSRSVEMRGKVGTIHHLVIPSSIATPQHPFVIAIHPPRHCERSEAIQDGPSVSNDTDFCKRPGLPRPAASQ